jgi:tetratricopeptide (TPR) repeat protein
MSFNKTKSMRNAERYLTNGRIEAAISEYRQIVDHDPKDIVNQNMLGDLYVKIAKIDLAVDCYKRVADHYNDQGFAKKAIAVYNKIFKLSPDSTQVISKLAELYQLRGSHAEARSHFKLLAERLEKEGKNIEVLEIWQKMADLDPGDAEICLKIARAQIGRNHKEEACKAYFEAGTRLAEKGLHKEASEAFQGALKVNERFWKAVRGIVRSNILLGEPKLAANLLEEKLQEDPYNKEFTFLLIDCYFEMNDPASAEKVITKLVEREPANYPKLLDLIKVYLKNEDVDASVRVLSMMSEHLLAGGDAKTLEANLLNVLEADPSNVDGLRLLSRCYTWQREQNKLKDSLRRMAEAANSKRGYLDERWALTRYLHFVPHDSANAARLAVLEARYGRESSDGDELRLSPAQRPAQPMGGEFGLVSEAEFDSVNESGSGLIAFRNQDKQDECVPATVVEEHGVITVSDESITVVQPQTVNQNGNGSESEFVTVKLGVADEVRLDEEFESIRFYIDQGYESLAEKAIAALEDEFGNREEIAALRSEIIDTNSTIAKFTAGEMKRAEAKDFVEASGNQKRPTEALKGSHDPLKEIASDLGLNEPEADKEADFEEHYSHGVAYKEMGLTEEAIREFQHAAECVEEGVTDRRYFNCCTLLGHCFVETGMPNLALIWYTRAFGCEGLSDEEKQALDYELGNVYELSGHFEEALAHFERVYAMDIDFRDIAIRLETLQEQVPVAG